MLFPKSKLPGRQKGLLDLKDIRYALPLTRKRSALAEKKCNDTQQQKVTRSLYKILYISENTTDPLGIPSGTSFHIIKILSLCSSILESTLNGKSRNVNIGDICLTKPTGTLMANDIPNKHWGRKVKLLFDT